MSLLPLYFGKYEIISSSLFSFFPSSLVFVILPFYVISRFLLFLFLFRPFFFYFAPTLLQLKCLFLDRGPQLKPSRFNRYTLLALLSTLPHPISHAKSLSSTPQLLISYSELYLTNRNTRTRQNFKINETKYMRPKKRWSVSVR